MFVSQNLTGEQLSKKWKECYDGLGQNFSMREVVGPGQSQPNIIWSRAPVSGNIFPQK